MSCRSSATTSNVTIQRPGLTGAPSAARISSGASSVQSEMYWRKAEIGSGSAGAQLNGRSLARFTIVNSPDELKMSLKDTFSA